MSLLLILKNLHIVLRKVVYLLLFYGMLMKKNGVDGLPAFPKSIEESEACMFAKQHRKYFLQSTWRAQRKLQLIHSDL